MKWKISKNVKHNEVKLTMRELVKSMDEISITDIPLLNRMSSALEMYYECQDILANEGLTMENQKGETVKRPEVNIQRDAWLQYVNSARELGLTRKSKKQMGGSVQGEQDTELYEFIKNN